jgi:transcriptional regulator with XRE-family HTH domain
MRIIGEGKEVLFMTTFGQRLKALRQALGLSQADLAERCGLKLDSVQNWEGKRGAEPRLSALVQLAEGLGVSLDVLAGIHKPRSRKTTRGEA